MSATRDHVNRLRHARGAPALPPPLPTSRWDIWAEGYSATGEYSLASLMASNVPGHNFADAVDWWRATCDSPELVDLQRLTYWGCRLYSNEADARRSFG